MTKKLEESNEGFYLDKRGRKCDAAFFADDDDFEWPLDYQIVEAKKMREAGCSDELIKGCYPEGLAALNK